MFPLAWTLLAIVVGCDWAPEAPGAEALGAFPPGTPREEVLEALGPGPLSDGMDGATVEDGYRTTRYFRDGESWQLVWVIDPDFTPADTTSMALQTPVLFREERLDGWGWAHLRETWSRQEIPLPEWAGGQPSAGLPTQRQFWTNLAGQCGGAYAGSLTRALPGNPSPGGDQELVIHFASCEPDELRLPLHLQLTNGRWDRSNTLILRRTAAGPLELRHDHRLPDGTEAAESWYGGFTETEGSASDQEFIHSEIDDGLRRGWRIVVEPGLHLMYGTFLENEWSWLAEFDLSQPVPTPPPAWGYEEGPPPRR